MAGQRARRPCELLLARASLEKGVDSAALRHALAVPVSNVASADGERLVMLALALDRVGARDSAAATYARAADLLPGVGDWLRVRAAAVTDDSAGRARLYAAVTDRLAARADRLERGRRAAAARGISRGRPALSRRSARGRPRFGYGSR